MKDFQGQWDKLDKDLNKILLLKIPNSMKDRAITVTNFYKKMLTEHKQIRDDYKESLQLVLVILGVVPPNFSFKLPGAFHKARWMQPMIYGLKMFLFSQQLKISQAELKKLQRFVIFVCMFYIQHWFNAPIAVNAPKADLNLYHDMIEYKKIDAKIADAVLLKFKGHTWYLNQEYVPLSLFSNIVSDEEKEAIAKKLVQTTPPKIYKGKVEI